MNLENLLGSWDRDFNVRRDPFVVTPYSDYPPSEEQNTPLQLETVANRRCVGEYVDRTVELFRTLHAAQNIEPGVREKWDSAYSTAGYWIKVALGVIDPNVTVHCNI